MKDFKIIFIHGWTASHLADWYPNISKDLDILGIDYAIPDLPGGENPHVKDWLDTIHAVISSTPKPIILVGHSLGTRTVLLYLEKYQLKVQKVFLISALANKIENAQRKNGVYADFFEHKIDIQKIKPLVDKFIVMHSKDDTSIPFEQGVKIAKDLNAQLIPFDGKDHFDAPENAVIILEELRKELDF